MRKVQAKPKPAKAGKKGGQKIQPKATAYPNHRRTVRSPSQSANHSKSNPYKAGKKAQNPP